MQEPKLEDFKTRLEYVIAFMQYRHWLIEQSKEEQQ